jgi:hypothetical protein
MRLKFLAASILEIMKDEEQKITVYCNGCDNTDYASKSVLEAAGWSIENGLELCPNCNF